MSEQHAAYEAIAGHDLAAWAFHDTPDPLVRYLRDRRLRRALHGLRLALARQRLAPDTDLTRWSALCVCGGVGGEASLLRREGLGAVTNSDFSARLLAMCRRRDPALATLEADAMALPLPDASFDLVVVQDGLHHLPRPVAGLNEMLRVARRAVIVLEPAAGLVGDRFGSRWEHVGDALNFVFRWDRRLFESVVLAQLLDSGAFIDARRIWDHSGAVHRVASRLGTRAGLVAARLLYRLLSPVDCAGNNFIGLVVKADPGQGSG